jgi:hypothetical protein
MNVEIGTEAAQLLFWECIEGNFVAVWVSVPNTANNKKNGGSRVRVPLHNSFVFWGREWGSKAAAAPIG